MRIPRSSKFTSNTSTSVAAVCISCPQAVMVANLCIATPYDGRSMMSGSFTRKSGKETPLTSTAISVTSDVPPHVPRAPPPSIASVTQLTTRDLVAEIGADRAVSPTKPKLTTIASNDGSFEEGNALLLICAHLHSW